MSSPKSIDEARALMDHRGDLTPGYVRWVHDNSTVTEFRAAYEGRENEAYLSLAITEPDSEESAEVDPESAGYNG